MGALRAIGKITARAHLLKAMSLTLCAGLSPFIAHASPLEGRDQQLWDHVISLTYDSGYFPIDPLRASNGTCADVAERIEDYSGGVDANVLIVSSYENGSVMFGSGTIIANSQDAYGLNRVVSAGHVVAPTLREASGEETRLYHVMAFDTSGALLAELLPVLTSVGAEGSGARQRISGDIAVLEALHLPHLSQSAWNGKGAKLAVSQGTDLLAIMTDPESTLINPGASGAGIYNEAGEIAGLLVQSVWERGASATKARAGLVSAVLQNMSKDMEDLKPGLKAILADLERSTELQGSTGIAIPITHPDVLKLLDPQGQVRTAAVEIDAGFMTGFSGGDCEAEHVVLRKLNDAKHVPVPHGATVHRVEAEQLDDIDTPNGGFGP